MTNEPAADLTAHSAFDFSGSSASRENSATIATQHLARAARSGVPCAPVRSLFVASTSTVGGSGVRVTDSDDDVELAWAYAVQRAFVAQAWPGEAVVGRKIGLTSPAVQAQLGVDQPDFGTLFSSMEVTNGSTVAGDRFLQPRAEGEIAFQLGADLDLADGVELTIDDLRAAITGAAAAIEICDSRIEGWDIRLIDTVADNASAGGYVLGERWVPLSEFEPKEAQMTMTVTSTAEAGREPITGEGAACLGDPLLAVLWLGQTCARLGDPLRAGEVVLSGALAPMAELTPGTHVEVTVSGLGSVAVSREEAGR